jgi:glutathione S-transferase
MRTLYHYPLCPYSRKVRLILAEKKLDFTLELEKFWEKKESFLKLDPAGQVPVLIELNGSVLADSGAISEYLEEAYPEWPLIGEGLTQRAEVRRLVAWFDDRFARDISKRLLMEKNIKRYLPLNGSNGPDSTAIRQAKSTIHHHLDYISWLVDRRNWLAGDHFSLADIAAAAHLSTIDYFGDVPWGSHSSAKDWYARIKSRPTFRSLLQDRVPGLAPSSHYMDLDF